MGDVRAGVKERVIHAGFGWEVYEAQGLGDELSGCYQPYGDGVYGA